MSVHIKGISSFFVGEELVTLEGFSAELRYSIPGNPPRLSSPNGTHAVGQLYVQKVELVQPRARFPLMMWHGGGLSGVTWETTPDGRTGWQDFFLRHGHNTLVSDASERGRASWPMYPEIAEAKPEHRPIDVAWHMFRFGPPGGYHRDPKKRIIFDGLQFPIAFADQFLCQFVARWTDRSSDDRAQKSYDAYVQAAGPAVIIAHSQGGYYAINSASRYPDAVKALILIEPVVPIAKEFSVEQLRSIPVLMVLGDNKPANERRSNFLSKLMEVSACVEVFDLPAMGIYGNSHMIMMDRNSDAVAALIQDWIRKKDLMQ